MQGHGANISRFSAILLTATASQGDFGAVWGWHSSPPSPCRSLPGSSGCQYGHAVLDIISSMLSCSWRQRCLLCCLLLQLTEPALWLFCESARKWKCSGEIPLCSQMWQNLIKTAIFFELTIGEVQQLSSILDLAIAVIVIRELSGTCLTNKYMVASEVVVHCVVL